MTFYGVKFGMDDVGGKLELMRSPLTRQAATGVFGWRRSEWLRSSSGLDRL
jgi:hypothetical protein